MSIEAGSFKWFELILKVGAGTAIGVWLVFKLTTSFEAKLDDIITTMNYQNRINMVIMQQTCINTSVTIEARVTCWNPWSKLP